MNATYAFCLPPFRQKKTGISKQMEIPVKSESIYEFIIAQRLTESKVALCFNSLHYVSIRCIIYHLSQPSLLMRCCAFYKKAAQKPFICDLFVSQNSYAFFYSSSYNRYHDYIGGIVAIAKSFSHI